MRPHKFRPWLVLATLVALSSCDLNPQPVLPARGEDSPATGGTASGAQGGSGGTGNLDLDPSLGSGGDSAAAGGAGNEPPDEGGGVGGEAGQSAGGQAAAGESNRAGEAGGAP